MENQITCSQLHKADYNEPGYEQLYEEHVFVCTNCGKRTWGNTTPQFRRSISVLIWYMFIPLSIVEISLTLANVLTIVSVSHAEVMLSAVASLMIGIGALALLVSRFRSFVIHRTLPVLGYRYFQTGIPMPDDQDKLRLEEAYIRGFLALANESSLVCWLSYALAGVVVVALTGSIPAMLVVVSAGFGWAVLFRMRLATIHLFNILDDEVDQKRWLQFIARHSRLQRFLALEGVIASVLRIHVVIIAIFAVLGIVGVFVGTVSLMTRCVALFSIGIAMTLSLRFRGWMKSLNELQLPAMASKLNQSDFIIPDASRSVNYANYL